MAWVSKLPFILGSCLVNPRKASAVLSEAEAFLWAVSNRLKRVCEVMIFLSASTPEARHDSILLICTIADAMCSLRWTRAFTGNKITCMSVATNPPVVQNSQSCRPDQYERRNCHTNQHCYHSLVKDLKRCTWPLVSGAPKDWILCNYRVQSVNESRVQQRTWKSCKPCRPFGILFPTGRNSLESRPA